MRERLVRLRRARSEKFRKKNVFWLLSIFFGSGPPIVASKSIRRIGRLIARRSTQRIWRSVEYRISRREEQRAMRAIDIQATHPASTGTAACDKNSRCPATRTTATVKHHVAAAGKVATRAHLFNTIANVFDILAEVLRAAVISGDGNRFVAGVSGVRQRRSIVSRGIGAERRAKCGSGPVQR